MDTNEVCVVTRVGPDRLWELDLWAESLERLELPRDKTRIVVGDNSGDAATRARITEILGRGRWNEWALLIDKGYNCEKLAKRPEEHSYHQARLFSRLVRASMTTPYILSLDTDTLAPSAEELGGLSAYQLLKSRMLDDVAVVGTPVLSRWAKTPAVAAYTVDNIEPWGRMRRVRIKRPGVVEEVQSFGTCLTLWRGDLLRKYEFKGEPNIQSRCVQGLEWWTYKMFLQDGFRMLLDWTIRPRHYKTLDEYVQVECA